MQRQPAILRQLRERIVRSEWGPGERMPSRGEFEASTGASRMTLQKAFDRLAHEGFIEVYGRRETRVAVDPPHLSKYALAFAAHPSVPQRWNRFWTALSDASLGFRRKDGSAAIELFHEVDGHTDVPDYDRLLDAARHHLVAGLILPSPPPLLTQTPLLQENDVPKVLIARSPVYPRASSPLPIVTPHADSFYDQACSYLKVQGCSSIGVVVPSGEEVESRVMPALIRHQIDCPSYWMHRVLPESAQTVSTIVHLMMRTLNDRPQGLIIADDHFTGPATLGLLAANIRVPDDVHVVVHENFPSPSESLLPFKRLGFDVREILHRCVQIIDRQRQRLDVPLQTLVEALFEDKLPNAVSYS